MYKQALVASFIDHSKLNAKMLVFQISSILGLVTCKACTTCGGPIYAVRLRVCARFIDEPSALECCCAGGRHGCGLLLVAWRSTTNRPCLQSEWHQAYRQKSSGSCKRYRIHLSSITDAEATQPRLAKSRAISLDRCRGRRSTPRQSVCRASSISEGKLATYNTVGKPHRT